MTDWRDDRDSDGFPVANEDREGDIFVDEFEVFYECRFVEGLGWCWVQVGRS